MFSTKIKFIHRVVSEKYVNSIQPSCNILHKFCISGYRHSSTNTESSTDHAKAKPNINHFNDNENVSTKSSGDDPRTGLDSNFGEKLNKNESQSCSENPKHKSNKNWKPLIGVVSGSSILGSLYLWYTQQQTKLSPREELTLVLKHGVLATQKGKIDEAQDLFHKALELAYTQHRSQIIDDQQLLVIQINIFGFMASLAVKAGDAVNAERLYKETMQKCLAAGKAPNDDSIVELSVKLSSLYATLSRDKEAEAGFAFSVQTMAKKVEEAGGVLECDTNTLALHGLALQSYARFLMKKKQFQHAIKLYKQSLDIAREVYGADHPQALVVLNDLASAYVTNKQFKEGIESYQEAINRAENSDGADDSLIAFYYNLGEACIMSKDLASAREYCNKCIEIARRLQIPSLIQTGEQCLRDVEQVEATLASKDSS